MERVKIELLKNIVSVYEQSDKCKLDEAFFKKIENELSFIAGHFKVQKVEAFFISISFVLQCNENLVEVKNMIEYFGCNPLEIFKYGDDFDSLFSREIFQKVKTKEQSELGLVRVTFKLNPKTIESIIQSKEIQTADENKFQNIFEFMEYLWDVLNQIVRGETKPVDFFEEFPQLISSNKQIPLIARICDLKISNIEDECLYYILICNNIFGIRSVYFNSIMDAIFDRSYKKIEYIQNVLTNKEYDLIKQSLIEIEGDELIEYVKINLSNQSTQMLQDFGIKLNFSKTSNNNIINHTDIQAKQLVFNTSENRQIETIQNLLERNTYNQTQKRLKHKNQSLGIAALLYGSPGTGKTEVVYQIARETNRDVFKVDISESKSKWLGESEKLTKKIFDDYRQFAKNCELAPILLFNEADAIISKRRDVNSNGPAKTENAIQNIILEELENFEGILFATTNLVNNLDEAFERRFLFKIEFSNPNIENRSKIWKLKINSLSTPDCDFIAENYNFSGGQINNIAKKCDLFEILNGTPAILKDIINFCSEEKISLPKHKSIGFKI